MVYIAFQGGIKTGDQLEQNEIEITEAQYHQALDGMAEGKIISVSGGVFEVIDPPPPEPDPEPDSGPPVRIPQISAVASLKIADGMINGIETAVGLSLAIAIDVGVYWVFFTEPQPDTSYIWNVGASSGTINVSMRDETMMQLTALDGGVPADPSEVSIQVFRVI